ncbi:MAG: ethylbenzene dehydrogenase-related protein [Planctomycetota bacterium]|jgi:hypothetical protein|nr:ethylbenzene dehydrogenase-related protein [Planctomycetota bacterium]
MKLPLTVLAMASGACLLGALGSCGDAPGDTNSTSTTPAGAAASTDVVSIKVDAPIAIDAKVEAAWDNAPATTITVDKTPYKPSNGYEGMTSTTMTMQSLYDTENVYFLVKVKDPTKSLARFPWIKQDDGSWKQSANKDSTGHDNTFYEDKFAVYWDINTKGFAKKGCAISCHMNENGKVNDIDDTSAGRKYTNAPGETIDMWHWKGVRTGSVGQVDDQYVNNDAPGDNKNWGRHGDTKTGGGYSNNKSEDGTLPAFMNPPSASANTYWIKASDKVAFKDTFKAGDIIPGIIVSPFTGHRGDISAEAVWADGVWTIEMQRKLVTEGGEQDVQFSDLAKTYHFGVSVFDNSQINHVYHEGVQTFSFK